MANIRSLWLTAREISAKQIQQEADMPFRIALVGSLNYTQAVADELIGKDRSDEIINKAMESILISETLPEVSVQAILLCDASYNPKQLAESLLDRMPAFITALGRRFPGLREQASARVIKQAATSNAELAMISAIPSVIPIAGAFIPAIADTLVLTKNQLMLLMRIAAIYGKEASWGSRLPEMLPVVGTAFGWRSLARELIGIVPGGVGIAIKGAIAYSGTVTAGRGSQIYFDLGRFPTRTEQARIFRDSKAEAMLQVKTLIGKLKPRKRLIKKSVIPRKSR